MLTVEEVDFQLKKLNEDAGDHNIKVDPAMQGFLDAMNALKKP